MTLPRPCPVCKRPAEKNSAPFCSPRCQDVDLHRWFTSGYAIPGKAEEEEEEADGPSRRP